MSRPTTTRSTALALLALMGLVGVIGAGLHSLVHVVGGRVDCWWYGASPCCVIQVESPMAEDSDPAHEVESLNELAAVDDADCPICTLLARFHAPPASIAHCATTALLHADVVASDPLLLSRATLTAHRPRGPPAWN